MSVLSVARDQTPSTELRQPTGDAADTNSQSSDDTERIDVAQRLSRAIEEFVSGLTPGKKSISVDWGSLSPIFSTLGDVISVVFVAWRWFV